MISRPSETDPARRLVALSGIAADFEPFVRSVLARICAQFNVPMPGTRGFADPIVEEELSAARARLLSFRCQFEEVYARLFRAALADELEAIVDVFATPRVQRFVEAHAAVTKEAGPALAALGHAMTAVVLYEEPAAADQRPAQAGAEDRP
jgi:hypothetical protein